MSETSLGYDPTEPHWYVQETGGRYLMVFAHHMTLEEGVGLTFHNADGSVYAQFLPGEWTSIEFG